MLNFMRCVAEAVMENGVKGLASLVPGGEFALKVAGGAYKKYRERKKETDQRKEIEELARAGFESAKQEAVAAVREAVAEITRTNPQQAALSEADRLHLELYLSQIPSAVQQSLKRPEDPSGRTAPSAFAIKTPDDVTKLLPLHAPRFKPGDSLPSRSDWVLERLLGVGGFGEVWLARHEQSTSLVRAVKFCLGQQARDLQHESGLIDRVMQAGQHPNIVPLLDMALKGDTPWLMYEYVQGGDLGDWIRMLQSRPLEERCKQAMAGLRQIASAVAHFHKLTPPVVHRDLKPNNILLDRVNKRLRITDFGIGAVAAKAALDEEARGGTSAAGRMMSYMRGSHTPLYASPQQRRGDDPDPRDDVHALGVIAYQTLTGDLTAAPGSDLEHDLRDAGAPEELIQLIRNSVAQKADRRPRDAREWAAALTAVMLPKDGPPPEKPPKSDGTEVSDEQKVGEGGPRLTTNTLGYLKGLVKLGATSEGTAVSKAEVKKRFNLTHTIPGWVFTGDPVLIDSDDNPNQEKDREEFGAGSQWIFWITPAGLRAIDNHVLLPEQKSKEASTSTDTDDEEDVWQGFWFVNVGEYDVYDDNDEWLATNRNWDDCRKYGFLAAGFGTKYSDYMKKLEPGAKVFAYMKGLGYVGYGEVTKAAVMARDFIPEGSTVSLLKLPLIGKALSHDADNEEKAEWVVGVRWHKTFDREEAKTFSGAFAGRLIVCKLRHPETVAFLRKEFDVPD